MNESHPVNKSMPGLVILTLTLLASLVGDGRVLAQGRPAAQVQQCGRRPARLLVGYHQAPVPDR